MAGYVPSVRMRRIARTLLGWREESGLTGEQIAVKTGWSSAKQSRIENATQPIKPSEVVTVALVLGIPEAERDAVFNTCVAAQNKGWWEGVSSDALVRDVMGYVELEAEAAMVRTFKIDLIPGLLQTSSYATAISRAYLPRASVKVVRDRVDARTMRQERVTGDSPIEVEAVLTEGALRTRVGGAEVMREQLERLLELADEPHIDLRVIPATGAYPAMGTPFALLSFADGYPDVGFIDLLGRGVYLEEPQDIECYRTNFAGLQQVALSVRKSRTLIAEIAGGKR